MDCVALVYSCQEVCPEGYLRTMSAVLLRFRLPFIILAMANLLVGLWSGLIRIGWPMPLSQVTMHHGAIMVGGFFTTLIALEKVIPLKMKLALAVPLISALTLVMIFDGYYRVGLFFLVAGSVGLLIVQCWYLFKYPEDRSALLMVAGAACLMIANVLLFQKQFYPLSFPWWMGFLLFTIIGERLELSRFLPVTRNARSLLYFSLGLFTTGLVLPFHGVGKYLFGVALIFIAVWLLKHDVIRIGIRKDGLTRYNAVALLLGNLCLMSEGFLLLLLPETMAGYDALVHTFFIGFGFTMVFAHGPIILPAVLGINRKPFSPILYIWLLLLQSSLVLRVFTDLSSEISGRPYTGLLTTFSIVGYFLTIITLIASNRKHEVVD